VLFKPKELKIIICNFLLLMGRFKAIKISEEMNKKNLNNNARLVLILR